MPLPCDPLISTYNVNHWVSLLINPHGSFLMRSDSELPFDFTKFELSAHSKPNYGSSTEETAFDLAVHDGGGQEGGPQMRC